MKQVGGGDVGVFWGVGNGYGDRGGLLVGDGRWGMGWDGMGIGIGMGMGEGDGDGSRALTSAPLRYFAADRFEGVAWAPANNGSPILSDSLAYMECQVVSRMETNDHWITYAEVKDGNVSKVEGRTAAHHRKIGDYY